MNDNPLCEAELNNKEVDLEVQDFGDAIKETKQLSPVGPNPDCFFGIGAKWGCG